VTVSRGTLGRLRAALASVRAALPPFCAVIQPRGDNEGAEAFEARKAKALARANGRRAYVVIVDRDEEAA
jgi:hypothetical protein